MMIQTQLEQVHSRLGSYFRSSPGKTWWCYRQCTVKRFCCGMTAAFPGLIEQHTGLRVLEMSQCAVWTLKLVVKQA
jgi:hypothetical protein